MDLFFFSGRRREAEEVLAMPIARSEAGASLNGGWPGWRAIGACAMALRLGWSAGKVCGGQRALVQARAGAVVA